MNAFSTLNQTPLPEGWHRHILRRSRFTDTGGLPWERVEWNDGTVEEVRLPQSLPVSVRPESTRQ